MSEATLGWALDEQFNYFMRKLFARDQAEGEDALKQIGERLAEAFATAYETTRESSGLVPGTPVERLMFYDQKPETWAEAVERAMLWQDASLTGMAPPPEALEAPYSWESQRAKYPREYEADQADWQRLRERALRGDFGPEMQMQQMAAIAGVAA